MSGRCDDCGRVDGEMLCEACAATSYRSSAALLAACRELAKYGTLRSVLYDDTLPDDFERHYDIMLEATRKVEALLKVANVDKPDEP